jgi:DNA repair photolyase
LRAVKELRKAGVKAGVLMAPVVPGFTTQPARLEATIRAIAEHDAAFVGSNVLHLKGGTKDHFLGFLAAEYPEMLDGYRRMYPGAYAPPAYAGTVRSLLKDLRKKYRVGENRCGEETEEDAREDDESCAASAGEQRSFEWAVKPSPPDR